MELLYIAGAMLLLYIGVWFYRRKSNKLEKIIVLYSEIVGDVIIEHDKQYFGTLDRKKDIFHIPKLRYKAPIPPSSTMVPTKSGNKKIYLIDFGQERVGYRVPKIHNQIIIEKRDQKGNIIMNNDKPVLIRYKWQFCDDVVEPDVKHWSEYMDREIERRHRDRDANFQKWIYPIGMALMFLTAVVLLNMTTKQVTLDKKMIMENAEQMEEQAQRTQNNLNMLMEKITGQRILEDETPKENQEETT